MIGHRVTSVAAMLGLVACTDELTVLRSLDADERNPVSPGNAIVWHTLATGWQHTCVLRDGVPFCWGRNDGTTFGAVDGHVRAPVRVLVDRPLVALAAGQGFTCGLDEEGRAWCWGSNEQGQLGQGDVAARTSPVALPLPEPVSQIAAGSAHACAVVRSGRLWCWGRDTEQQLGLGSGSDTPPKLSPVQVGNGQDWRSVACGDGHSCAIRGTGELWCWGRNSEQELGVGREMPIQIGEPIRVGDFVDWVDVDAGVHGTCGRRRDGSAWCWGSNDFGQLGTGDKVWHSTPLRVTLPTPVVSIDVTLFHTCALGENGDARCWGWNDVGHLGVGDAVERLVPTLVPPPGTTRQLAIGWMHTCLLDTFGDLRCAGRNGEGQLGIGSDRDVAHEPELVLLPLQ